MPELIKASESYIHNHFLQVIQEDEYADLPKNMLVSILQSELLRVENEFQVFTAAMQWILHEPIKRRKFIFDVMTSIRFPIIPHRQLDRYCEELSDLSLKIALKKMVQDFRSDRKLPHELKVGRLKPHMLQPRKCARKKIYMVGGYSRPKGGRWSDSQSLTSVECFDSFHQIWKVLPELHHPRSGHGVAVLGNMIYVIGGESDSLIYDNVECYDPSQNTWTEVACMTVARCGLGVCTVGESIYALGGWIGSEIGDTIEKYDLEQNKWCIYGKILNLRFAMSVIEHKGKSVKIS